MIDEEIGFPKEFKAQPICTGAHWFNQPKAFSKAFLVSMLYRFLPTNILTAHQRTEKGINTNSLLDLLFPRRLTIIQIPLIQ